MAKKKTAAITGVGAYLPDYILDNIELSQMVDTSDEWIMSRIGIKTRHILKGEGLGTSFMGEKAVLDLLEKTGVIVVPGSAFGRHGEGYVRMALVVPPERMQEVVRRIAESGILNR